MRRIVAVGAAVAIASLAFVSPAEAAKAPPKSNRPITQVFTDDLVLDVAAGEACAFPVKFLGQGTVTLTTQRQKVKEVVDATVTITNVTSQKSVTLNADAVFVDRLRRDGSSKSTSKGNAFFWGDVTVKGKAVEGLLLIKGKTKFTIADYSNEDSELNFTKIKGTVTDVCTLID